MRYYDAHNHAHDAWLTPHRERIAAQLGALPLEAAVVNGTGESDWPEVLELARRHRWVRPSLGLHPWDCGNRSPDWASSLECLLAEHPEAAVGEIGLDRWILDRARPDDPRLAGLRRAPLAEQREVFKFQLQLAVRLDRAATIHCLEAWGALLEDLRAAPLPRRGFLLHAYSGPAEMIRDFAGLGAYFSFNGSFLEERRGRHRELYRSMPRERLLIETDAPAMAPPTPWRTHKLPRVEGQEVNHPGNIEAAYAGLAAFLGEPVTDLAAQVEANFTALFGRPA